MTFQPRESEHPGSDLGHRDAQCHSLERLVELHVLAEHGDSAADAVVQEWLATDPQARKVWDTVERACTRVRARTD